MRLTFDVHERAKQMVADGYTGQNMNYPDKAENYILNAAGNPNVERELPEAGFGFWKIVNTKYWSWKARRDLAITTGSRS